MAATERSLVVDETKRDGMTPPLFDDLFNVLYFTRSGVMSLLNFSVIISSFLR